MQASAPSIVLTLLLLAPAKTGAASAPGVFPGVTLTRSDRAGVAFEIEAGDLSLRAAPAAPEFSELTLSFFSAAGEEGQPALPSRILWIGIPQGAELSLEATAEEVRAYHGVKLMPQMLERDGQPVTRERIEWLAASSAYREVRRVLPLARVSLITGMRAQRVAGIEIQPVRYDPRTGDLEVATRIAVQVRFEGKIASSPTPRPETGFESVYRQMLLNYDVARDFRGPIGSTTRSLSRVQAFGPGSAPVGFDVAAQWVKVSIERKGIQEIRGSDLQAAGVPLGEIDPANLRLLTRPGVPLLDEESFCDTCGLSEVAIRVEDGGDGRLDPEDRILFFGLGPSGWRDDFTGPGAAPAEWLDHPYENRNVYWLAWNTSLVDPPRRWGTRDVSPTHADVWQATSYPARLHFEADAVYAPDFFETGIFWDQWAWVFLRPPMPAFEPDADCSGAVESTPARLRARLWGRPPIGPYYGPDHVLDVAFNGQALAHLAWFGELRRDLDTTTTRIVDGPNRLSLRAIQPPGTYVANSTTFFWWELRFLRRFQAVGDTIEFTSPDTNAVVRYQIAPFSDTDRPGFVLLDVTDPLAPVELTGWTERDTSGGRAVDFDDPGGLRSYFAAAMPRRLHPLLEPKTPRDPRSGGADYLIICSDDLESMARRLADHRAGAFAPFPGATSAVVRISDILDWYSGGRMDPTAIRNFLHDIVSNRRWSPAPTMVCLLGDATYDFKNVLPGPKPELAARQVPTYEHGLFGEHFPSDDWLVDLDAPPLGALGLPDLIVGRLPAADPGEASDLVEKIVSYDSQPVFGDWRSRILLVADDLYQGSQPDPLGGTHIAQADSLARRYLLPWLDPYRVFLVEYGFTTAGEKGGAREQIHRQLDRGAVFWHYIGHGNPFKLADESAFTIADVPAMANGLRLPVFFAAGCEVGPFDNPVITPLAEALVKLPLGGAIASFASPAVTYASQNYDLGRALYHALFTPAELGGAATLGEALFVTKHRLYVTKNDISYHLLGDPGMRIAVPRADIRIQLRDDETGVPLDDSLSCGRRVRLEAEVLATHDPATSDPLASFEGTAIVRVSDAPKLDPFQMYPNLPSSPVQYYEANPRTAFLGEYPVRDGRLTARFVLPAEARLGQRARVEVYASNESFDASGSRLVAVVAGDSVVPDPPGPEPVIHVRSESGGTVVGPDERVIVSLEDPNGIFTLADSTALGIQLAVDQNPATEVTDRFAYDVGSSTRGTLSFVLDHLSDGEHQVTVSASSNLARLGAPDSYRTETTVSFQVARLVDTTVVQGFALPNPFPGASGTHLVFSGFTQPTAAEVLVFDISGRLVRRLSGSGVGHVEVDWDGTDRGGRSLRSGIYLYRANLRPEAGGAGRELEGRLVLLR